MSFVDFLPVFNASMNGLTFVCLIGGLAAIRSGNRELHRRYMLFAISLSAAFLTGYVTRILLAGTHRFPDVGLIKTVYLTILLTHSILAAVSVPIILFALYVAMRGRFVVHKRIVRYAWPMWAFSSLTGVIIYVMLYHLAPTLSN